MIAPLLSFARLVLGTARDLAPIVLVIAFFQIVVLEQSLPDLERLTIGLAMVMGGLALFVQGLEMGLFPIGESMADAFARKGSLAWLMAFAFALGFGATVAEPALIAVAAEAARVAGEGGMIADTGPARLAYAEGLRYTVAVAVGVALVLGVLRILKGWPIQYFIIVGYVLVVILTTFAPDGIVGIAYDSGGVTTSTVTVPLVTALGLGLANAIPGRSALIDGFGLIAFASLFPMITVMGYAQIVAWRERRGGRRPSKEE